VKSKILRDENRIIGIDLEPDSAEEEGAFRRDFKIGSGGPSGTATIKFFAEGCTNAKSKGLPPGFILPINKKDRQDLSQLTDGHAIEINVSLGRFSRKTFQARVERI